jgi:beta-fructofuranosidase
LAVYCDRQGWGGTPILVEPAAKTLTVGEVQAPFELQPDEHLELRVFLDKNVIEVFANDRQAVLIAVPTVPRYPGVALISEGATSVACVVEAWKMRSVYPEMQE